MHCFPFESIVAKTVGFAGFLHIWWWSNAISELLSNGQCKIGAGGKEGFTSPCDQILLMCSSCGMRLQNAQPPQASHFWYICIGIDLWKTIVFSQQASWQRKLPYACPLLKNDDPFSKLNSIISLMYILLFWNSPALPCTCTICCG